MRWRIIYSQKCLNYETAGHPESPERVKLCAQLLKRKGVQFLEPQPCNEEEILLAHSWTLLEKVKKNSFFDPDTPNILGIFDYALLAAGAAVKGQEIALRDKVPVLSLMRPPGHHAGNNFLGGFCYFNNIAIAICASLKKVKKAAILDIDCHHGNGTQDIFLGKKNVLYLSLHQSPLYPGTGLQDVGGNCFNYPLPPGTGEEAYLKTLQRGLERIEDFQPEIVGISLGFDTHRADPLTNLLLETATYRKIGAMIAKLSKVSFAVLEGGYHPEIADCLYQFLLGWNLDG